MDQAIDVPIDVLGIEAALARAGLSVAQFCRKAEIEQSTWQRLKNGDSLRPRKKTRRAVADALAALGVTLGQGDESSPPNPAANDPGHVHSSEDGAAA